MKLKCKLVTVSCKRASCLTNVQQTKENLYLCNYFPNKLSGIIFQFGITFLKIRLSDRQVSCRYFACQSEGWRWVSLQAKAAKFRHFLTISISYTIRTSLTFEVLSCTDNVWPCIVYMYLTWEKHNKVNGKITLRYIVFFGAVIHGQGHVIVFLAQFMTFHNA